MAELTWRGAIREEEYCDICGVLAGNAFRVSPAGNDDPASNDEEVPHACRECLLDPDNGIAVEDERGDVVDAEARAQQVDDILARCYGMLEDHVSGVLSELADVDTDFNFGSMLDQWQRRRYLTPKQMTLVQWRLKIHGIDHKPSEFRVSTRRQKEVDAVLEMDEWKRERLLPYLSEQQKTKLGI